MNETFYLIDGHSQIMRAYWGRLPPLTAPGGEPTKATFLFAQLLLQLIRRKETAYLAVAMDPPGGAARRMALYPQYKAGRERMPEDLVPQIARIRALLAAAGVPVLTLDGEEADDVIATVAERVRGAPFTLRIVSGDKDLYQLLRPGVVLFDPKDERVVDAESLVASKGFRAEQFIEIQTLAGDSVDNVPGIPGVGLKTAARLIARYGSARNVMAHADELPPKLAAQVRAFAPMYDVTRELVALRRDCPIDFALDACRTAGFDLAALAPIFAELNFTSLMGALPAAGLAPAAAGPDHGADASSLRLDVITDAGELGALADTLRQAGAFAVDTETTSLRPRDARLVGISLAWDASGGVYIPLASDRGPTVPIAAVKQCLGPLLEDPNLPKIGQNLKYDLQTLRGAGLALEGLAFDTMVASYLLEPERRSHGLDALARELLNYTTIPITDVIGRGAAQIAMTAADPPLLARYAAEDAAVTFRLWEAMRAKLDDRGLGTLFHDVEMPLVRVLADMEWDGIALDTALLARFSGELEGKLRELRVRILEAAGCDFNPDSPKQLAEVLFDRLGLPVVKRTRTARSTDAEVLQSLAAGQNHPLPGLVLRYRELAKLKNTYVDVLPAMVSPATGRLHPSYHQAVTATGRLSSSDPNIQNIPIRTEEGRRIRSAFVAGSEETLLISADYSQIELRFLAHFSGDPVMRAAFERGEDIHRWVAGQIWGLEPDDVPGELRTRAKAVNFGIIYGQTPFGLARTLGIPRSDAARFIARYKAKFQGVTRFMADAVDEAARTGLVRTILGRLRRIPDIASRHRAVREQAERLAINTRIQGSAADLIKVAMVRMHEALRTGAIPGRMLVQVHDELVFEVPRQAAKQAAEGIDRIMTSAMPLEVALKVDMAAGRSWLDGKA